MVQSRLFERLAADEPAYGAFTVINQPEIAEIVGYLGLDFVCMDMMMGALDWRTAAAITQACDRYGLTSMLRLQAFPWTSKAEVDPHVAADVLRAGTIGAESVMISLETPEQVAAALAPAENNHRRIYLPKFEFEAHGSTKERSDHDAQQAPREERTMVIPLLESQLALDNMDDILSVPGLEAIFLGMGDLSEILGHANDFEHPALREFIIDTAQRTAAHGVKLFVNIHGRHTPERIRGAAEEFWKDGVKGIFIPFDTAILIRFYRDVLTALGR